jgi:hypothetical protein
MWLGTHDHVYQLTHMDAPDVWQLMDTLFSILLVLTNMQTV